MNIIIRMFVSQSFKLLFCCRLLCSVSRKLRQRI